MRRAGLRRRRRAVAASMRRLGPAAAGLTALVLTAGCQLTGGSAGASGPVTSLTVAAVPGVDNAPLELAIQDHLFSEAGLKVTIRHVSTGQQAIAALSGGAGGAQIAATDYGQVFTTEVADPGLQLRIVADGYDAQPGVLEIVTLPDSGITSPSQLASLRIGVPDNETVRAPRYAPDSLATAAAETELASLRVGLADISWVPLSPAGEISALQHRQVKAILVGQPQLYQAEAQLGAIEVLDVCSGATASLPLSGYVTTAGAAAKYGTAIARFRSALLQAQRAADIPGRIQRVLQQYALPSAQLTAQQATQDAPLVTLGTYPSSTVPANVERVSTLLWESGVLPETVPDVQHMFLAGS